MSIIRMGTIVSAIILCVQLLLSIFLHIQSMTVLQLSLFVTIILYIFDIRKRKQKS